MSKADTVTCLDDETEKSILAMAQLFKNGGSFTCVLITDAAGTLPVHSWFDKSMYEEVLICVLDEEWNCVIAKCVRHKQI